MQPPPKETNRNEAPGNTSKPRVPVTTSVSPSLRPRSFEKWKVEPLTPNQKERLFEEFLQWQRRTTDQGVLAMADDTGEALAPLPLETKAMPSPGPRSLQKLNVGSLTPTQKGRLFDEFLEWQKRTTIQGILAAVDNTNERYAMNAGGALDLAP
jgi:hypothetical protein